MLWSSLSSLLSLVSCLLTNLCALNETQQENSYMYVCTHKGKKKQKQEQNKKKKKKRKRTHIEERCRTAFSQAKYLKISLHLFYK